MHRELKRKHVTPSILWEEYIAAEPGGYRYSRFRELYRAWEGRLSVTMRQSHAAGDKLFVDHAGDGVPVVVDRLTGIKHQDLSILLCMQCALPEGSRMPDHYRTIAIFSVSLDERPKPTVVIHRDGKLEPDNPDLHLEEVNVVLQMEDDWVDITPAQYRAMIQLVRLVLHQQPLARIVFEGGARLGAWTTCLAMTVPVTALPMVCVFGRRRFRSSWHARNLCIRL
ncbi:hypothetical protein ACVINW_003857 [Bradyrhizobium sp. USDA 4461]